MYLTIPIHICPVQPHNTNTSIDYTALFAQICWQGSASCSKVESEPLQNVPDIQTSENIPFVQVNQDSEIEAWKMYSIDLAVPEEFGFLKDFGAHQPQHRPV